MWAGRLIRRVSRKVYSSQLTADSNNLEIKLFQLQKNFNPHGAVTGAPLQSQSGICGAVRFLHAR